jgi:hypothetical protein
MQWQRQICDEEYIGVLCSLARDSIHKFDTAKMTPGPMRDLLETTKVEHTEFFSIKAQPGAFYYLAVHFGAEYKETAQMRNQLRFSVNLLREIWETRDN